MKLLLIGLGLVLIAGCATMHDGGLDDLVVTEGRIHYVELEGGFFGIVSTDGRRFLPLDLAPRFRRDGLRVRFRARILDDVVTVQMWGTPVRLESIEALEDTSSSDR